MSKVQGDLLETDVKPSVSGTSVSGATVSGATVSGATVETAVSVTAANASTATNVSVSGEFLAQVWKAFRLGVASFGSGLTTNQVMF